MTDEKPPGPRPGEGGADRHWLGAAVSLGFLSPTSSTAYAVGAVVVGADGREITRGFSRETGPTVHAEQVALGRISLDDPRLDDATLYTSLEPCSTRSSAPYSCTELILATAIPRVVMAMREPPIFVECEGEELLRAAGVEVIEMPEMAAGVRQANEELMG